MTATTNSGHAPSIQCFDELTRGNNTANRLDYGKLKFLTSGGRGQPVMLIAANIGDLPDLLSLQNTDVSFTNRLVTVTVRARFLAETDIDIHSRLDQLSKGLCRVLLDAFKAYRLAGNKLLPVPRSMQVFKGLVVRCSASSSCNQQQIDYARDWAQKHLQFGGHRHSLHILWKSCSVQHAFHGMPQSTKGPKASNCCKPRQVPLMLC